MITQNINIIPFYLFENLNQYPELLHFVSTREGGISEGTHSSLNLSLRVNDDPYNVKRNREVIALSFGIDPKNLIFPSQTHDDKVEVIDKTFLDKPEEEQYLILHGVDAMITNLHNVCLCILTADCASILIYDAVSRVIGIAHAGWKGTVKKIAAKAIETMKETYGCYPKNMVVAIGPCIYAESFEVGEEVASVFNETFQTNGNIVIRNPEWPKPHVDIVAANIEILKDCGIKSENIEASGICTFQNAETFFSARQKADGRFGSGIMIK